MKTCLGKLKKKATIALVMSLVGGMLIGGPNGSLIRTYAETQTSHNASTNSSASLNSSNNSSTALSQSASDLIQVYTASDLLDMAKNPSGSYELMSDIDMTGLDWKPFDFSGSLNGQGYKILNLKVEKLGDITHLTYDGNMKTYDTYYSGLFSSLINAKVSNLSLLGLDVEITSDQPTFIGGICGYADKAEISNCVIDGKLSLTSGSHMMGVAGILGFGNGSITDTKANTCLINIDSNIEDKDEQFMGGAVGDGYVDMNNCEITVDGYTSDHGYVHDGGVFGMYRLYPYGNSHDGFINYVTINGKITFFEDNIDRRAYCAGLVGEVEDWVYTIKGNVDNFTRNEVFDYSKNLLPEGCEKPNYTDTKVEATDTEEGYTLHSCANCGYEYKDAYTLKKHNVTSWEDFKNYDNDQVLKKGLCLSCNETVYKLEKVEKKLDETKDTKTSSDSVKDSKSDSIWLLVGLVALLVIILIVLYCIRLNLQRKRRRKHGKRKRNSNSRR